MATGDYTLLATVKAELPTLTGTSMDARITRLITAASRAVDSWTKRPAMAFTGQTETRDFDVPQNLSGPAKYVRDATLALSVASGNWPNTLVSTVDIDPLLSTPVQATVKTDDGGAGTFPTAWTANTDFYFLPMNAALDGYPYRQLRVNPNGTKQLPIGPKMLRITGTWGYSQTAPYHIEQAVILTVIRWLKRPDAPFGVMGSADTGMIKVPEIDPDVLKILRDGGFIQSWVFA